MKHLHIHRFFLALVVILFLDVEGFSQSITFDNAPPVGTGSTAVGVSGGIVFNFTTNQPIIIDNFRVASSAATTTATIWYTTTKINGQPVIANMNPAGGWFSLGSASHTGLGNTAIATIPVNCNLRMNANDTFGFFIQFSGGNVFSNTTTTTPIYSNGTVSIIADPSCAFTRNATTWFGPTRQFNGGVIYRIDKKGINDASVSQLVSPNKFCGTTQDLTVKVANRGINAITNATVNWAIDGAVQAPISLFTWLDTLNHPTNKNDTNITLGTITYTPNVTKRIDVWTSMPNGQVDTTTNNDSLTVFLRPGLNGTYTIASSAADFTSPRSAINAIESFGRCGPLTFEVTAGEIFTSTPLVLSNLDSITFQKFGVGVNPIVYGVRGTGTTDAVFRISGSKNIVFDGIDVADSISNAASAERMEYGYSIINSSATLGSSNNIIRNCKVTLNRANTASFGIVQSTTATAGGVAATSLLGGNHNNRYENVKIENAYRGMVFLGTAGFPDSNCVITSAGSDTTIIGANTPNDIGNGTVLVSGISVADQKNIEISKCVVRNVTHTGTSTTHGIFIDNGSTTVDYGTARVWGNTVFNINRTTSTSATGTVHGIRIDVSTTASARVWNNVVYDINSISTPTTASANQIVRGISMGTTTGTGNAEFYFNSVSISPSNSGLNHTSTAFWKGGTGMATLRNNIFANTSPAQTGVSKHFASYLNTGSIIASNNVLWSPNANGFVGFAASDRATLAAFAAATSPAAPSNGNEQGSVNVNPNFTSTTNLGFSAATPAAMSGVTIATPFAITTDITGNTRSLTAPSIGAYETTQSLLDSAAPVITNVIATSGTLPVVYATISDNQIATSAGNIQLWYRLGNAGPFTAIAPDSTPAGMMNGTYKWEASLASIPMGTYQYYIAVRDQAGAGLNIAVNPIQAATFTNFNSTDPVNYNTNPDPAVNTRSFNKLGSLAAGTYSIGPSGNYAKLSNVAAALNTSELQGNVVFEFEPAYDGTSGETFPIVFNQFGTSGGNWTVTIRPASGASALQVRGGSTAGIIDLNGAKRIAFDGRPAGIGTTSQLSFINTSNTGSVFRFINDAQHDTLRYLNVLDSNTSATSGNIFFSTTNVGTSATNGNSNNFIDNCSINGLSNTVNCIYSSGSASPADNKNNTITNCNIFDFNSNTSAAVNGILLEAGNSNWNIGSAGNGNNFYQTAARTSTSAPALTIAVTYRAIQLNSATINGCNIIGNRIGGNILGIVGSTFIIGDNVGATAYLAHSIRAIDVVAVGTTSPVSIQGNTISNMTLYSGNTSTTAGVFSGINVLGGLVNTGNISGNTVGSATGTGSINIYYKNTSTSINFYGIRYTATAGGLVQNNNIGSISADAATGTMQLLCLYASGAFTAALTISNNTIGSLTTAHSIQSMSSSLAPVNVMGVVTSAASGAAITIAANTIINISSLCTNASTTNGLKGIYVTGASSVSSTISNNIVRKLYSESTNPATDQSSAIIGITSITSGAGFQTISGNIVSALVSGAVTGAINIMGVYYGSTTTSALNSIERNLIHSLNASASNGAALVSGITQGAGTARLMIANNMIRLGFDSSGIVATGPHFITGIHKLAGNMNITIFNTVDVGGSGVANGVSNSYAYRSNAPGVDSLLNNIFINTRTNASGGGIHYAIGLGSTTTLTVNRNLYNSTGTLGQFNNINQATLTDWRVATTQDAQSVNTAVTFVSNTDLHLAGASIGDVLLAGVPIAAITTDFDGQTRSATFPYMGADENLASPVPVKLLSFTAKPMNKDAVLLWQTASELNNSHFTVERSTDGREFTSIDNVKGKRNSQVLSNYTYTDKSIGSIYPFVYYRLRQVDIDGTIDLSDVMSVDFSQIKENQVTVAPNPFNKDFMIIIDGTDADEAVINVMNVQGKTCITEKYTLKNGENKLVIPSSNELENGIYFVQITTLHAAQTIKVIKN